MRLEICMTTVVCTLNLPKNVSLSLTSIHEPRLSSRSIEWNFPSWLYNSRNLLARYVAKPASCDCNAHVSALPRRCCWYECIPIILQILATETWIVHVFLQLSVLLYTSVKYCTLYSLNFLIICTKLISRVCLNNTDKLLGFVGGFNVHSKKFIWVVCVVSPLIYRY
jgi:hypothetical protein